MPYSIAKIVRRSGVVVFVALSTALAVVEPSRPAITNFDARQKHVIQPVLAEKRLAVVKLRERLPQAQIDFDEITGSPRRIASTHGFLTGPNGVGGGVQKKACVAVGLITRIAPRRHS